MLQRKGAGRLHTSDEETESVCTAYTKRARKSIRRPSTQLQILRFTIDKVSRLYALKHIKSQKVCNFTHTV